MQTASTFDPPRPATAARANPAPKPRLDFADDEARLRSFGEAIDAIRKRAEAEIGAEDVAYFERIDRFSRRLELVGRALIHISFEPVTFFVGVGALWVHKQLQCGEIGHAVMHGAFDHLPEATRFHSKTYRWDFPLDEPSWENAHVRGHHVYANIVGRDDNIHYGIVRFNEGTPWRWYHALQPLVVFPMSANLGMLACFQMTGLTDVFFGSGRPGAFDFIEERSPREIAGAFKKALRKWVPYYAKNYVFYPLLAGPFFPKVLLGNWMAESLRDLWLSATVLSGHIANDVSVYPEGTRAKSRGEYYAMQASATNNYEASPWVSLMSGALDCHIEHHLFPHLPPNRLRMIRREVEEACDAHGVPYRREPWVALLKKTYLRLCELARRPHPTAEPA